MAVYSDGLAKLRENLEWFLQSGVDTSIIGKTKEPISIEKPRGIVSRPEKIYVPEDDDVDENTIQKELKERALDNWGKIFSESQADAISSANTKKDEKPEVVIVDETMDSSQVSNKDVPTNKMGLGVDVTEIEEATALSGLSPTYLVGDRQKYIPPKKENRIKTVPDKNHETKISFEELEAQYSGSNKPPKEELDKTVEELKNLDTKVSKSLVPPNRIFIPSTLKGDKFSVEWNSGLQKMITGGEADNYDTISNLAKTKPPKKITSLTVGELKQWMEQETDNTASGLYQINKVNLEYLLDKKVISEGQIFDKDTQDKAYESLLEKRHFQNFKTAIRDPNLNTAQKTEAAMEMQLRLAQEWASIPIPYDLPNRKVVGKPPNETYHPNGLKAGMSYYESKTNAVPNKNKKLDFLKYLLSFADEEE